MHHETAWLVSFRLLSWNPTSDPKPGTHVRRLSHSPSAGETTSATSIRLRLRSQDQSDGVVRWKSRHERFPSKPPPLSGRCVGYIDVTSTETMESPSSNSLVVTTDEGNGVSQPASSGIHQDVTVKTGARRSRYFPDIRSTSSPTAEPFIFHWGRLL